MSRTVSEWVLNLKDNISPALGAVMSNVQKFGLQADKALNQFGARAFKMNQLADAAQSLGTTMEMISGPGQRLNRETGELASMVELTDQQIKSLEKNGRELARTYGGDAADAMGAMQDILSSTNPELAKTPEALRGIVNNSMLLGKTMRGDVRGATEALVTAMNAYGVSFENPNEAMAMSARMMDMITKGALVGSATVPRIAQAMQNLGGTASAANVGFAETQAALQLLDQKGFKKGAEGGIAFRNVLLKMGEGRFMPKETREALAAAGVDVARLADKSLPLADRLRQLDRVPKDLLSKMFGIENVVAAEALVKNVDTLRTWTGEIANNSAGATQSAAGKVMATDEEKIARMKARIDDLKITVYNALGGIMPYAQQATMTVAALGMAGPGLLVIKQGMVGIWQGAKWAVSGLGDTIKWVKQAGISVAAYTMDLWRNRAAHLFNAQVMAVMARNQIVGMLARLAGMLRLATVQQWLLNTAMSANPIGVIVLALAAVGLGVYMVMKHWDAFKVYLVAFGKFMWNVFLYSNPIGWMILGIQKLAQMFPALGKVFSDVFAWIKKQWDWVWNGIKSAIGYVADLVGLGSPDTSTATAAPTGDMPTGDIGGAAGGIATFPGGGAGPGGSSVDNSFGGGGGSGGTRRNVTVNYGGVTILPGATINGVGDLQQIRKIVTELFVSGIRDGEELSMVAG